MPASNKGPRIWRAVMMLLGATLVVRALYREVVGYSFGWGLFAIGLANVALSAYGLERPGAKPFVLVLKAVDAGVLGVGLVLLAILIVVTLSTGDWSGWSGIH